MAARTPASRDRYVDFLRAFSIATVVLGHWLIAIIVWRDGRVSVQNAVGVTSGLWLATWVLQVMPLFFFVGGFSNLKTYEAMRRRRETYRDFMRARAVRLWKPTLVFVGVWAVIQLGLHIADVGSDGLIRGSMLPFGPMWFLFVYMGVIAATPVMLRLHRRFGVRAAGALAAGVIAVDVMRFALELEAVAWLNLALVWLLVHQIGFFYADGSLVAAGPRVHTAMALGGLAGLVLLTNIGVYPRSMVGTDIEVVSNMNPPTACIAALTSWLVGAAMLLRDRINRWLQGTRPWAAVIAANSMIMTVFLWHLTAYLVAILLLYPLGLGHPTDSTASWWLQRPVWLVAPAVLLVPFVVVFARFERSTP
jgi:peptidoglycan/LPS O-acetylase OafA/YrhL